MRRTTLFLLFVLFAAPSLSADQAPFGPLRGTIREVIIERQVEGDPVPFHVALDTQVGPGTIRTLCDNSSSPVCLGLFASRSTPAACDYPNLPQATQDSIIDILGDCARSCWIQTGNPDDFAFFREIWSCEHEEELPCIAIAGTMIGTTWIDPLLQLTDGQERNRADAIGPCPRSKPRR